MWLQFCSVMDLKIGIFFNEVIGWEGGDFKGNQIRRKCLVECEYDQNKVCTYFDLNVI